MESEPRLKFHRFVIIKLELNIRTNPTDPTTLHFFNEVYFNLLLEPVFQIHLQRNILFVTI